jgi:hypothetical protein
MQTNIKNTQVLTPSHQMKNTFKQSPNVPTNQKYNSACPQHSQPEEGWEIATNRQHVKTKQSVGKYQANDKRHYRQTSPDITRSPMYSEPPISIPNQVPIVKKTIDANDALKMVFPTPWNVWIHQNSSKDWSLDGYDHIMIIENVGDFWSFINAFNKINYMDYQFFVMRGNIAPIWEAPENRYGGAASIRLRLSNKNLLSIWEDICLYTINNQIYQTPDDINGISFNLKNDLTVIKVWNNDGNLDISGKLSRNIVSKYKLHSIVYIKNRPEY